MFGFEFVNFVVLAMLALYAFFKVDRTKPVGWMVVNVVWLVGLGALALTHVNVYLAVGLGVAVVRTVASLVAGVSPFSNLLDYVRGVLRSLFTYPVTVFEYAYGQLKSKISL